MKGASTRRSLAVALLWLAAVAGLDAASPALAETQVSAVDYKHLADLIVNRSWKLAPGERVVLFSDATRDPGIAAPLREAIKKAGGVIEEIAAPDSRADAGLTPRQRADRFEHWKVLFQRSQAAIWLPSDLTAVDDQPFEHLVEASKVRSIHFHWFLPPDAPDVPVIQTMYQQAIEIEPAEIARRIAVIEKAIRGATVRVTAPNGTDFTCKIPPNAHMHRNTGEATRERVRDARSVRDREEELPASVLRTTDIENAQGTFVGYVSFDTRSGLVRATFKDGKVTALEPLRGADAQVEAWRKARGAKDRPRRFKFVNRRMAQMPTYPLCSDRPRCRPPCRGRSHQTPLNSRHGPAGYLLPIGVSTARQQGEVVKLRAIAGSCVLLIGASDQDIRHCSWIRKGQTRRKAATQSLRSKEPRLQDSGTAVIQSFHRTVSARALFVRHGNQRREVMSAHYSKAVSPPARGTSRACARSTTPSSRPGATRTWHEGKARALRAW